MMGGRSPSPHLNPAIPNMSNKEVLHAVLYYVCDEEGRGYAYQAVR